MYQRIDESIEVIGVFSRGKFTVKKFRWQGREHRVAETTLVNQTKDGGVRQVLYSVVVGGTLYRLQWNQSTHDWKLEEIWYEG